MRSTTLLAIMSEQLQNTPDTSSIPRNIMISSGKSIHDGVKQLRKKILSDFTTAQKQAQYELLQSYVKAIEQLRHAQSKLAGLQRKSKASAVALCREAAE